jgi:hypothetical protein
MMPVCPSLLAGRRKWKKRKKRRKRLATITDTGNFKGPGVSGEVGITVGILADEQGARDVNSDPRGRIAALVDQEMLLLFPQLMN